MPNVLRRILLIRHGPSAHSESPGWIDAAGVNRWREAYDAAGILPQSAPPPSTTAAVAGADVLVTSDLPRALASAERLAPGKVVRVSPLFREMSLEVPQWVGARWPLSIWALCIHAHWLIRERRGEIAHADELQRAANAVAVLDDIASEVPTVAVVTHGAFRRILTLRLAATGWRVERRIGGYRNWSVWPFSRVDVDSGGGTGMVP